MPGTVSATGAAQAKASRISPLARRLVAATVAFSTLVALVATAVQLYMDYRRDLGDIEATFQQVNQTYLPTIANALWATSRHQIQIALDGLVQLPDVHYVEVSEGEVVWGQAGRRKTESIKSREYPLTREHRGHLETIGTLRVVVDMDAVYRRLVEKFWVILISNSIKTFFVAGFMLWLFHWLVARHLRRIADFAAGLGIANLNERLSLARPVRPSAAPDEFDWVLTGFNQMQANLAVTLTALQQEIAERGRVRRALSALASGTVTTPDEFYGMVVRELAEAYNVRNAFVGLISDAARTRVRTLAVWAGQPAENTEYDLAGTPCADILSEKTQLIADCLGQLYPGSAMATQLGLRSFYGAPLVNRQGLSIGLVAILGTEPMPQDVRNNPLLGVYAQRIATELERSQALDALHQTLSQLEQHVEQRTLQIRDQARIIDEIHDSVITTDMQNNITGWNRGAQRLFGYRSQEMLGQPVSLLYPAEDAPTLLEATTTTLLAQGQHELETRMRHKSGHLFFVHLSLSVLHDNNGVPRGIVGYTMDITARKHAEALAERRTTELEAANRELEAFSYSVSHDLRSPLRSIDGFSKALIDDYGQHLDETGHEHLQRVRRAAQRMGELIDDMLKLARVARADMHRSRVDLSALAADVIAHFDKQKRHGPANITVQPGMNAYGDASLLRIVLENLLDNAYKYTSKTAQPRIELGTARRADHTVYFVRDNGAGFDMAYASKLFGPFQRLHRPEEFPGTGVGLATVKRIIHRHGGEIWAESSPDAGAVFYFTLRDDELAGAAGSQTAA